MKCRSTVGHAVDPQDPSSTKAKKENTISGESGANGEFTLTENKASQR